MGGSSRVGHWECGDTPGYVRAQRGRARSALFSRVSTKKGWFSSKSTISAMESAERWIKGCNKTTERNSSIRFFTKCYYYECWNISTDVLDMRKKSIPPKHLQSTVFFPSLTLLHFSQSWIDIWNSNAAYPCFISKTHTLSLTSSKSNAERLRYGHIRPLFK